MILLAALLAATQPTATTGATLAATCREGVDGERSAALACRAYVTKVADALTGEQSTCLSQPVYDGAKAVWAYLAWIEANPQNPDADASPGVMAALVDAWPCGWAPR